MERKMVWGHVLFASVTALLAVAVYQLYIAWSSPVRNVASPLTTFGLWILIGSSVYAKRPWHKHLGGAIGLSLVVVAAATRYFS